MRFSVHFRSLAVRMVALVLAALTVFTLALGLTAYTITRNWLERTAVSSLEALASARQTALQIELRGFLESIEAFVQPDLEEEVTALLEAEGSQQETLRQELAASMRRRMTADHHSVDACIVDLEGSVIVQTSPEFGENLDQMPLLVKQGAAKSFISDPFARGENVYLDLSTPLGDVRGDTMAVLILRVSGREILSITGDYTGLGETGETVLGARRGDEVHFLAPLRFDPNMSQIEPAPADGERAKPMIHATAGQSGTIRAMDYRDTPVVAAYRPISPTGWGLAVKQDIAETLANVARLQTTLIVWLAVLLGLGAIVTFPLAYTFTRPLRELEDATRRVSEGDLSARVPGETDDEVGRLARSFNAMVEHLREADDDLQRKNQELSAFAYVVSHDLKAPLRAISSLAEWLQEDLGDGLNEEHQKQMNLLRGRVRRMDGLINGLLEYSRLGRARNPSTMVHTDALARSMIDAINPPDQIRVEVSDNMPTVRADELRLGQIFQNLIDNAVKHHPGPEGNIQVDCRETGEFWEFSVRDDGAGIDRRYHQRIFQIFQTLQARDEMESTGMGLSLVEKIVEDNGGKVWVESDGVPGEGTIFRFTWPKGKD